jgi:hypothetical protein
MPVKIALPINPFRGTRGVDSWGSGNFGASRDGGARQHAGLDFVAVPGDPVYSPIDGVVSHIGIAYQDSDMRSIHVSGVGQHHGMQVKLLYVQPDPGIGGRAVISGDRLGDAQDVAAYWAARKPDHAGEMRNHVHVEIALDGPTKVDPAHYLPADLTVQKDLDA